MADDSQFVDVDDTSLRSRTINPRRSTVAGFVGPAASGPVEEARALASADEFALLYGDGQGTLGGAGAAPPDFLQHAVRSFFAEGGTRAYVVRTASSSGRPPVSAYEAALQALTEPTAVSIVAAPGSTYVSDGAYADPQYADAVVDLLISHAERMRDRIAVVDSVNGLDPDGVRGQRSRVNSPYAAFYYPWLHAIDSLTGRDVLLPPSGFVAGIYARVDAQRGIWRAPDDEVVQLAAGLEREIDPAQRDSLAAAGINSFCVVNDRVVLWDARTASDDSDWKYVNVRRYAAFVEHSVSQGLHWVVFEPNTEALWSSVRQTVEDFLSTEWRSAALVGNVSSEAYFVRCDRSTMTQQDLDEGRLNCVIGMAVVRPAEFVIFEIGLWTSDHHDP